ncbi:MAG: glycogen/starch synthase, partial [Chlamydiia bacterium]|nr:glycogen/starch synthase [Chlamydiia bacterium]
MYIVHLTTELAPLAKVGGLGDVTAGLSKALTEEGEKVEVILPFYDHIDRKRLKNLTVDYEDLVSYEDLEGVKNTIWSAEFSGISLILIEPHSEAGYFERGVIYGESDDLYRFTYFTKTALEYLLKKEKHPDVLNLHDWLTALAAPLYYEVYKSLGLKIRKVMTTIHNMKYQGVCAPPKIERLGLRTEHLQMKNKMQDPQEPQKLNLLKGGLVYSDCL